VIARVEQAFRPAVRRQGEAALAAEVVLKNIQVAITPRRLPQRLKPILLELYRRPGLLHPVVLGYLTIP
jgi:hypothetical protein